MQNKVVFKRQKPATEKNADLHLVSICKTVFTYREALKRGKYIPAAWDQNPSLRHTKASPEGEAAEKSHGK